MALELPTLRIGLAGFSLEQQESLRHMLQQENATRQVWDFGKPEDADALCINGARTQLLPDGMLRIGSGVPAGRSLLLDPSGLNRPAAFVLPVPNNFPPYLTFVLEPHSVSLALRELEILLRPLIAQFCLASQILEQEAALGSGVYHVSRADGTRIAVVDLRGDVGVLTSATSMDFDDALWTPHARTPEPMPQHFYRCSLSHLMWQYAMRTTRDILPARYRTETLYFRRAPRLPHRLLGDAHLLLLRELASEPGNFADLQARTQLPPTELAADLAALYLVGAITSNPKRAAPIISQPQDLLDRAGPSTQQAFHPSRVGEDPSMSGRSGPSTLTSAPNARRRDRTAPAPLQLDH
ncbi:MAG: hypothetical protein ACJ8GO_19905 [Ramlibacter sp.]